MVAYKFYLRDEMKGIGYVGVFPERRKDPKRITNRSVIDYGRIILGHDLKFEDIFYKVIFWGDNGIGNQGLLTPDS